MWDFLRTNAGWVYPLLGFVAGQITAQQFAARQKRLTSAITNLQGLWELEKNGAYSVGEERMRRACEEVEVRMAELYDRNSAPPRWFTYIVLVLVFIFLVCSAVIPNLYGSVDSTNPPPPVLVAVWAIVMLLTLVASLAFAVWTALDRMWACRRQRKLRRVSPDR